MISDKKNNVSQGYIFYFITKIFLLLILNNTQLVAQQQNESIKSKSNKKVIINFNDNSNLDKIEVDAKMLISSSRNVTGKHIGEDFPVSHFVDINGNSIDFKKLKNKIVVINFWFVGCKGCRKEEPLLKKLTENYKDNEDVVFISFCNSKEASIKKYISKHGDFGYQIIELAGRHELKKIFGIREVPTHYIVYNGIIIENFSIPIFNNQMMIEYLELINTKLPKK